MRDHGPYGEPLFSIGIIGALGLAPFAYLFQSRFAYGWLLNIPVVLFALLAVVGVMRWRRRPN